MITILGQKGIFLAATAVITSAFDQILQEFFDLPPLGRSPLSPVDPFLLPYALPDFPVVPWWVSRLPGNGYQGEASLHSPHDLLLIHVGLGIAALQGEQLRPVLVGQPARQTDRKTDRYGCTSIELKSTEGVKQWAY